MNDKQQLNEILNDIKNGIDRKNDLLMNGRVQSAIRGISSDYAKRNNFEYNEVYQNSIICFYDLVRTYTFYDDEDDLIKSFINYLNRYLPLRLNDTYDSYSLYRNSEGARVLSLDVYDEFDFMDEDLQTKINIREEEIDLNIVKSKLNDLEYKILLYVYEQYTEQEIADKLGCTQPNVHYHKKKLFEKIIKFIY